MANKLDCINVHKPNCIYYIENRQCPDNCEGYEKVIIDISGNNNDLIEKKIYKHKKEY
jgi:hypothetical protein